MNQLISLSYLSRNAIRDDGADLYAELNRILSCARSNNPSLGITGALLFSDDCFAQVLEGPAEAVDEMYRRISTDPRHSDVTLLQRDALERRSFPQWSMAFAAVATREANGVALGPELAASDGPANGHALTKILHNLMRLHAQQSSEPLAWPSFDAEQPVDLQSGANSEPMS